MTCNSEQKRKQIVNYEKANAKMVRKSTERQQRIRQRTCLNWAGGERATSAGSFHRSSKLPSSSGRRQLDSRSDSLRSASTSEDFRPTSDGVNCFCGEENREKWEKEDSVSESGENWSEMATMMATVMAMEDDTHEGFGETIWEESFRDRKTILISVPCSDFVWEDSCNMLFRVISASHFYYCKNLKNII